NDCDGKIDDYTTAPTGPTYEVGGTFTSFGGYPPQIESIGAAGQWLTLGTNVNDTSFIAGKRLDANGNVELSQDNVVPWSFFFDEISSGTAVLALGHEYLTGHGVAAVVNNDLTVKPPVILSASPLYNAHGAWTGSRWVVAFSLGSMASYARISPQGALDGQVLPVPTTVLGAVLFGSPTYGVSSGGNAALAYQLEDGAIELAVLNPNDGTPQTLFALPWMDHPVRYVITGTPNGYGAFWDENSQTKAALFQIVAGQVIKTIVTFPLWTPATAATPYGAGLAFSITIGGQPYYAYWRGGAQDPVEMVPMFIPGSALYPGITSSGGKLTISYLDNVGSLLSFRRAGCP
ncbi:MAG: hypothetical protein ABI193_10790, partial [Minicystis sp.]